MVFFEDKVSVMLMGSLMTGASVASLIDWMRGAAFTGVDTNDSVSIAERYPVTAPSSASWSGGLVGSWAGLTAAVVVALLGLDLHCAAK